MIGLLWYLWYLGFKRFNKKRILRGLSPVSGKYYIRKRFEVAGVIFNFFEYGVFEEDLEKVEYDFNSKQWSIMQK